jgi:hypothetical protein
MFAKHVSSLTSAFYHNELPPEQSRRVAEHLLGCLRCRAEFEEIKFGASLAGRLPLIPAPDSLWHEIEAAVGRNDKPATVRQNHPRPRFIPLLTQPRFAMAAVALVGLVVVIATLWFRTPPPAPRASWNVARLDGTPRIGSAPMSDNGKLGVGQWLETDRESRAQISVSDIGEVEIDPNTRVRLVETNPTEHRMELAKGRLSARISAPPKLFFVNTPSGVAEDLGCAYTLEVDDSGNSLLRVTSGWVALQLKDRESMVPAEAACATRPGIGPGTPYFEDASEIFRTQLASLDFASDVATVRKSLDPLLKVARVRDTLTLWHLLARVSDADRVRVYERLVELVPHPPGVTREGVLELNRQMLDSWKNELELNWYSYGSVKTFKKAWSSGFGKIRGFRDKK